MPADDLPGWVQYAQALVAPVLTIAGVGIAWGQLALARARMKHDLYDRRYKIFQGARAFIVEVCQEGRAENERVLAYHRDTGDAVFLLKPSVLFYLNEIEKKGFRLAYLRTVIAREDHPKRNAAIDEEANLLTWFSEQFDPLVQQFKPFLQLESSNWRDFASLKRKRASFIRAGVRART
jgi:hypothetical protein